MISRAYNSILKMKYFHLQKMFHPKIFIILMILMPIAAQYSPLEDSMNSHESQESHEGEGEKLFIHLLAQFYLYFVFYIVVLLTLLLCSSTCYNVLASHTEVTQLIHMIK